MNRRGEKKKGGEKREERREINKRGEKRRNEKYQRAVNTKVNISIKDTENTSDRN